LGLDPQTSQTALEICRVRARVAERLRVIDRVHTKLKLRLIWFPAGGAHEDVDVLRLDDETPKLLELVTEAAAVALRDRKFTRGEPVWHGTS
jgi:hypothetical protein